MRNSKGMDKPRYNKRLDTEALQRKQAEDLDERAEAAHRRLREQKETEDEQG